jgi:hypothetical protein
MLIDGRLKLGRREGRGRLYNDCKEVHRDRKEAFTDKAAASRKGIAMQVMS